MTDLFDKDVQLEIKLISVNDETALYSLRLPNSDAVYHFTIPQPEYEKGIRSEFFIHRIYRGINFLKIMDPQYHAETINELMNDE